MLPLRLAIAVWAFEPDPLTEEMLLKIVPIIPVPIIPLIPVEILRNGCPCASRGIRV